MTTPDLVAWTDWLAAIGYGIDFSSDTDPPCTLRELAEAMHRADPSESVETWEWCVTENTRARSPQGPRRWAMTTPDLVALRAIAEAATPGPWVHTHDDYGDEWWFGGTKHGGQETIAAPTVSEYAHIVTGAGHATDAAHIATFDPPTVLALLDTLAAVEAVRDHYRVLAGLPVHAADVADRLDVALGGGE